MKKAAFDTIKWSSCGNNVYGKAYLCISFYSTIVMKKYFLAGVALSACMLCLSPALQAQKKGKTKQPDAGRTASPAASTPDAYALQKAIYDRALRYNDYDAAKNAVFAMLELKPENTSMKDSLALIYYNMPAYIPCILVGREILETDKNNTVILEITAASERNMGLLEESLNRYRTLHGITGSVFHLFQVASVQFDMQQYDECKTSLDRVIADPDSEKQQVMIQSQQGQQQPVPVKAAAYNMHGIIAMTNKDTQAALAFLDKALLAYPEFELAKLNREAIQKEIEQEKKEPASKTPASGTKKKK